MLNVLRFRLPLAIGGLLLIASTSAFGQGTLKPRSAADYPVHQTPLALSFNESLYTESEGNLTARFYLRMQEFAATRSDGLGYEIAKVTPRIRHAMPLYEQQRAKALLKQYMAGVFAGEKSGEVRCRVLVKAGLEPYDTDLQGFPLAQSGEAAAVLGENGFLRVYLPSLVRDYPQLAGYTHFATSVPSVVTMKGQAGLPGKLELPEAAADWLERRTPGGFEQARLYLYLRLVGADTRVIGKQSTPELVPVWEVEHYVFEDVRNGERLAAD